MGRRTRLTEEEIAARLVEVPEWTRKENAIERKWKFHDFVEALRFINDVGSLAEEANHHPDIYNSWNRVVLSLMTHDRGGLTVLDFDLAKKIDVVSKEGPRDNRT